MLSRGAHTGSILQPNLYELPPAIFSLASATPGLGSLDPPPSTYMLSQPAAFPRDFLSECVGTRLTSARPPSHPVHALIESSSQQANAMDDKGCVQWLCDTAHKMACSVPVDHPRGGVAVPVHGAYAGAQAGVVLPDSDLLRLSSSDEGGLGGYVNGSMIGRALVLETRTCTVRTHCADDVAPLANATDSGGSGVDTETRARDQSWTPVVRDPHEAHGVGVIVKALAQQNAGASLFLRAIVCVVALLCFVHSIVVLGERPPSIGCRK